MNATRHSPSLQEIIVLGACGAGETLPQNPDLPADVFTACLTTPIKVGARVCVVVGGVGAIAGGGAGCVGLCVWRCDCVMDAGFGTPGWG